MKLSERVLKLLIIIVDGRIILCQGLYAEHEAIMLMLIITDNTYATIMVFI